MDLIVDVLTHLSVGNYLTAALVLITGWYAWLTRQTVVAMRNQNERLTRPYVTVRLVRDRTEYILMVENTGQTPAENLRLELDREFYCLGDEDFALSDETLFSEGVGSFSPGEEVGFVLGTTLKVQEDRENMPARFTVTARYSYGDTDVEEKFDVNLQQFAKKILVSKGTERELKEMREALEEISDSIEG